MTGVDHDIGAGGENKIPESITQSGKVQQVSKIFPVIKSPTPHFNLLLTPKFNPIQCSKGMLCSSGSQPS